MALLVFLLAFGFCSATVIYVNRVRVGLAPGGAGRGRARPDESAVVAMEILVLGRRAVASPGSPRARSDRRDRAGRRDRERAARVQRGRDYPRPARHARTRRRSRPLRSAPRRCRGGPACSRTCRQRAEQAAPRSRARHPGQAAPRRGRGAERAGRSRPRSRRPPPTSPPSTSAPYVLTVGLPDPALPIISLTAAAPDAKGAARLITAAQGPAAVGRPRRPIAHGYQAGLEAVRGRRRRHEPAVRLRRRAGGADPRQDRHERQGTAQGGRRVARSCSSRWCACVVGAPGPGPPAAAARRPLQEPAALGR